MAFMISSSGVSVSCLLELTIGAITTGYQLQELDTMLDHVFTATEG